MWLDEAEFEDAVGEALGTIPDRFLNRLDNVVISVEPEPTREQALQAEGGELLGLYVGVPLPERGEGYGMGSMPDHVFIFSGPIQRVSRTRDEAVAQIKVTVLHEIGHYFGIDDARLHELGWG